MTNTVGYMDGRKKYQRPQAMLWADNPGKLIDDGEGNAYYIPEGYEINTDLEVVSEDPSSNSFLILSDHNRGSLDFNTIRFEKKERMINGRLRSYHIADKLEISVSWDMLPSRSFASRPDFNSSGVPEVNAKSTRSPGEDGSFSIIPNQTSFGEQYTVDGGAGGAEILKWYETYQGPFWVYLAYDKYTNFGTSDSAYAYLQQYNQIVEMYISSFDYSVVKRGGSNHDFWNVSVSLEEV